MVPILLSRRRAKATLPNSVASLDSSKLIAHISARQFKLLSASATSSPLSSDANRTSLYISFCIPNLEGLVFKLKVYPEDDYTAVYSPARYKQSEQTVLPLVELSSSLLALFPLLSLVGSSSASLSPVQHDCKLHSDINPWKRVIVSLETALSDSKCSSSFIRAYLDGVAFSIQSKISFPFKTGPMELVKLDCEGEEGQQIGFINSSTFISLNHPDPIIIPQILSSDDQLTYMADKSLDLEYLLRQRRNFPVHAILVHGPAGCGKTHMVEQVSKRLGFKLVPIEAHDILDVPSSDPFDFFFKTYAQQPSNNLFDESSSNKLVDVILFLDDVEVLLTDDEISDLESQRKIQIHFESLVDSIRDHSAHSLNQIVVICASNNPSAINASTRNLFEREIVVSLPSPSIRLNFLKSLLKQHSHLILDNDTAIEELSASCHGFSLADLDNLVRIASTASQLRHKRQSDSYMTLESKENGISIDTSAETEVDSNFDVVHLDESIEGLKRLELVQQPCEMSMEDLWSAKRETTAESMKSDLHLIPSSVKRVDVSQVGGLEVQYDQLMQSTVWIYKYGDRLARMGVSPPKGILLFGPPGTGKTMLAKCVASASNANFLSISISDLIRGEIGGTEQEISKIFKIARSISPCIIFLDEIQALFGSRDSSGSHGKNMISQLLLEMDGLASAQEVIVIGATNRPDWIDAALLRPGRFERCLYIPPPSETARLHILEANLRKFRIDASTVHTTFIKGLAKRSERFSGADLANLCLKAAWKVIQGDSAIASLIRPKFGSLPPLKPNESLKASTSTLSKEPLQNTDGKVQDMITSSHLLSALSEFSPTITQDMISLYESFQTKYGRAEQQKMAQGDPFANPEDLQKDADKHAQLQKSHVDAQERHRQDRLAQIAAKRRDRIR